MSILRTGTATFKGAHVNTKESKQGCFDDTILAVCFEVNAGWFRGKLFNCTQSINTINIVFHIHRGRIYV